MKDSLEKKSLTISEYALFQIMPLIRLSVLILTCWYYPFYYVLPLYYCIIWLYYKSVQLITGWIPSTSIDCMFVLEKSNEAYTGLTFMEVPKGRQNDFTQIFLEKFLKTFPKFRAYVVMFMGDPWWQVVSHEEAKKTINIRYIDDVILKNPKDLAEYSNKELKNTISLHRKNFPYEILVFTNPEGLAVVGFKYHHGLSDGVGFTSAFFSLSNNYSLDIFPMKFKSMTTLQSIMINTKMAIFLIYYILKNIYQNYVSINCGASCFKYKNHNMKKEKFISKTVNSTNSEESKKIEEEQQKLLHNKNNSSLYKEVNHTAMNSTLFSYSDPLDLAKYKEISKHLKISFNDLVISVINAATNKFYKDHGYNKTQIGILCPISKRGFPENYKDVLIENNAFATAVGLPLIDDPIEEVNKIKSKLADTFRDIAYIFSGDFFVRQCTFFLPDLIMKILFKNVVQNADFTISNVAGPKEAIFYDDIELINYYPFITTGLQSSFIVVISYNKKFYYFYYVNEGINLDPWEVMEYFDKEFQRTLENFNKLKEIS